MTPAEDIRPPEVRLGPHPERMEPLWDRVERNRFKLFGSVALFVVGSVVGIDLVVLFALLPIWLFSVLSESVRTAAGYAGLVLAASSVAATVAAIGWAGVALSRSEQWLVLRLGATISPKGEDLPTKMALKDMAIAAGMAPAPAFYVLETTNVNAFVFAASRRRPIVGVTRGLIDRLPIDEQRAVFANLVARLRSGDTIHATGVTALTRPLWSIRDGGIRRSAAQDSAAMFGDENARAARAAPDGGGAAGLGWLFFVAAVFVAVTEVAAFGSRRTQLRQAEVADAEGMLLLRDPQVMLAALEDCIRFNNYVPTAGPGFAQLFYCWTGDATSDEEDPEWRRVLRLREVLGVEGLQPESLPNTPIMLVAPAAPRLER